MASFKVTPQQIAQFHEDGYLIVPRLITNEETDLLYRIAKADPDMNNASGRGDAEGRISKLMLRNDLGDDIYSAVVRSQRIVHTMAKLLDDEVYHFHHKMMVKEPRVGGAWEWHQDYGYWYLQQACLWPDMGSCMIAVDRATKENGCLQVIRGSHRCGRVDHGIVGQQTGADLERVEAILQRLDLVYVAMEPGDSLFFHANLLHRSAPNESDQPRWTLICCYNTKHNDKFKDLGPHPGYAFLDTWPDEQVMEVGRRQWEAMRTTAET